MDALPPPVPRKPFLLRLDPQLHRALQRWADDELRSLNGQLEYLLRKSLKDAGRGVSQDEAGLADERRDDDGTP